MLTRIVLQEINRKKSALYLPEADGTLSHIINELI